MEEVGIILLPEKVTCRVVLPGYMVCQHSDGRLEVWNTQTRCPTQPHPVTVTFRDVFRKHERSRRRRRRCGGGNLQVYSGGDAYVDTTACFAPVSDTQFMTGDTLIKVWDIETLQYSMVFQGVGYFSHLRMLTPSRIVGVSRGSSNSIGVWSMSGRSVVSALDVEEVMDVCTCVVPAGGTTFVTVPKTGPINVWAGDTLTHKNIASAGVTHAVPAGIGRVALATLETIEVWNVVTLEHVETIRHSVGPLLSIASILDANEWLVTTSTTGVLCVWNLTAGMVADNVTTTPDCIPGVVMGPNVVVLDSHHIFVVDFQMVYYEHALMEEMAPTPVRSRAVFPSM